MKKLDITEYRLKAPVGKDLTAAVLSDIHGEEYGYILSALREFAPDMILIPGDVTRGHISEPVHCKGFFAACAGIAPVFFSFGNHENNSYGYVKNAALDAGVHVLESTYEDFYGLHIGGLSSGFLGMNVPRLQSHWQKTPEPDLVFLKRFSELDGYKILLNHHPEYYNEYIKNLDIDLTLSGHAHGGQCRLFGHPVFAPGQGFFPKLAQGFADGRMIVSRGLANNGPVPRFGNRREVIILHFDNI